MNLSKLFKRLHLEEHKSNVTFLGEQLESDLEIKLAIDHNKNPVILISNDNFNDTIISKSNYRLNYLEVLFNQNCSLFEVGEVSSTKELKSFTIIKLIGGNARMIGYYLNLMELLIFKLEIKPSIKLLNEEIGILIDLFSVQKAVDKSVALGLWGELYYINQSKNVSESVRAWHNDIENTFDFTFRDNNSLEIKTTNKTERVHEFSQNQINNYNTFNVEIASIMTQPSSFGVSIKDLWNEISDQLVEFELKSKLTKLISLTIKSDFQALYDYKYNIELANSTIKYFNTNKIPKITEDLHPSIRKIKMQIDLDSI